MYKGIEGGLKSIKILPMTIPLLLIAFSGCQKVASSSIDTNAVYARIDAQAHQDGVTNIEVQLTVGAISNTVLELTGGDRLTATAGGVTKDLRRDSNILGDIKYVTEFNNGNDQGTEFKVSFDRQAGVSAPNSVALLPAPFTIDMPVSGDTFTRNDSIVVVWNPAGSFSDVINVDASGTCGNLQYSTSVSDPVDGAGMASYQAAELLPTTLQPGVNCETSITLRRRDTGTIDSNFDGGYYTIEQRRTVTVNIVP